MENWWNWQNWAEKGEIMDTTATDSWELPVRFSISVTVY